VRFAALQHDIEWCERERNFTRLDERIDDAVSRGAEFVLLSETFSTGFAVDDSRFAEPEGGPSSTFLVERAVRHGIWIGGTCPEVSETGDDDPRPANTFVVAAPDGATSRYRKIHPFTYGGEDAHVRPGRDLVTVKVGDLRVSLFVCYDLRFADEFWALARDTDVYLVPANWPSSRREHWVALLRARATENQAWVIGCNRVGEGGGLHYGGDSMIVDPHGEIVALGGDSEETLFADVTAERVAEIRNRFRFLQDRR